jgi:FtsP/CotA-like multicopper oxidase with cupredoxin domain
MQVVAIDSQPVQPYMTQWASLGVGQRIEVVITANATPGNYWIRAVPNSCVSNLNTGTGALANAILSYEVSSNYSLDSRDAVATLPTSTMATMVDGCFDEMLDLAIPIPAKSVDRAAFNLTHVPVASPFKVTSIEEGRVFRWLLGSTTAVVDWENPILQRIVTGNNTFTPRDNVIVVDNTSSWAFWYVQNSFFEPHP